MFTVVKSFTDLQDGGYKYNKGDVYPREGLDVAPERIAQLSSAENLQGVALIKETAPLKVVEEDKPAEEPVEKPAKKAKRK